MQKGVDAIAIGVIALGVVVLIVLFMVSNNMMPQPIPAPTMPDLNATRQKIDDPLGSAMANLGAGGMQPGGMPGGIPGGFGSSAPPSAPPGGPGATGRGGRRGAMPDDY